MNKIMILGNAYKRGELGESKNGIKYQNIRLMDKQRDKNNTFYFECIAFGKTAEFIDKYVENGKEVVVFGELKEDKKDKKFSVNVLSIDLTASSVVPGKKDTELKQETAQQEDIF